MMSTDQNPPLTDETPEEALAAQTRAIWRRVGHGLARYVDCKVNALVEKLGEAEEGDPKKKQPDDGPLVRKISASVIAAQRTLELENSYGQKVQHDAAGDAERDNAETARRIEKVLIDAGFGAERRAAQENAVGGGR